jgi:hypothetical protein
VEINATRSGPYAVKQTLVAPSNAPITQCLFLVSPIPWKTAQGKPSLPRILGHRFGSPPNGPGRSRPAQSAIRPSQTVSNDLNFHPLHLFSVICIHQHHRTATNTWSKTRHQKWTARSQKNNTKRPSKYENRIPIPYKTSQSDNRYLSHKLSCPPTREFSNDRKRC